ncbi:MAG: hypothetical protein ABI679_10650 [Gemmatimonadota bacterium]
MFNWAEGDAPVLSVPAPLRRLEPVRMYEFRWKGRILRADLTVTDGPFGSGEDRPPHWIILDNRDGHRWSLSGVGSPRDSLDTVRQSFQEHLSMNLASTTADLA